MSEFLTPDHTLYFQKAPNPSSALPYSLVGVDYKGSLVPLRSSLANTIAGDWILPELFPDLESLKAIRPEVSLGNSRFDFVITYPSGRKIAIEVKSCSLVEQGVALFPDAPSSRALKHLKELEELQDQGWEVLILFVISHGSPRLFRPLVHADPELALALSRTKVGVRAVSTRWNREGQVEIENLLVPLDLGYGELALEEKGVVFVRHRETESGTWWLGFGGVARGFRKWSRSLGSGAGIRRVFGPALSVVGAELTSLAEEVGWSQAPNPPLGSEKYGKASQAFVWWRVGDVPPEYHRPYLDLVFRYLAGSPSVGGEGEKLRFVQNDNAQFFGLR